MKWKDVARKAGGDGALAQLGPAQVVMTTTVYRPRWWLPKVTMLQVIVAAVWEGSLVGLIANGEAEVKVDHTTDSGLEFAGVKPFGPRGSREAMFARLSAAIWG